MSELIIFCNPKQIYSGKPEREVAKNYTKMAFEDYEKNLLFTLFFNQAMICVGKIKNNFKS